VVLDRLSYVKLGALSQADLIEELSKRVIVNLKDVLEEVPIDWNILEPLFNDVSDSAVPRLFASLLFSYTLAHLEKSGIAGRLGSLTDLKIVPNDKIGGIPFADLQKFAKDALDHPKVRAATERVLKEATTLSNPTIDGEITAVKFVEYKTDTSLFGFSGLGTVYINVASFAEQIAKYSASLKDGLPNAVKLAYTSIIIHENARIKFRKMADNPVHYGPAELRKYRVYKPHVLEIGVLAEIFAYDSAPAWFQSTDRKVLEDFVVAFRDKKEFPSFADVPCYDFRPGMYHVIRPSNFI